MSHFFTRNALLWQTTRRRRTFFTLPPPPSILYSSNHLLAVNKPAGWHSIPLERSGSNKCLLTWLKQKSLGGGSRRDFLLPLHRLDQPCSGVLLLAKTSKAASRITTAWKLHEVKKQYTCMLSSKRDLEALKRQSQRLDGDLYELKGLWMRSRKQGSVRMTRVEKRRDSSLDDSTNTRLCTIQWRMEQSLTSHPVIVAETREGARHMVRALLSQVGGAPICGDVRYGASPPLPDRSVALHASRVTLPESLVLPLDQHDFVAPLPAQWNSWFR
jgi:23S rRNA pseudouridine1911/1915/1917 synthase